MEPDRRPMKTLWICAAIVLISAEVLLVLDLRSAKKREFAAYEMGSMIGRENERRTMLKRLVENRVIWVFISDGKGETNSRAVFFDKDGHVEDEKLNAPGILP